MSPTCLGLSHPLGVFRLRVTSHCPLKHLETSGNQEQKQKIQKQSIGTDYFPSMFVFFCLISNHGVEMPLKYYTLCN